MSEHQVTVALEPGALEQSLELAPDLVSHRHGAGRAAGLRRPELAPDVVLAHPDPGHRPVDVAPAQRHQLTLAQSSHRRGEEQRPVDRLIHAGAGVGDHGVDFL
jgi:hypothetical protein